MLDDIILEVKKKVMSKKVHARDFHIERQVGSSVSMVLRSSEEIFIRNPDDLVKTKGHPKCPTNYNQYLKHHKERKGKN